MADAALVDRDIAQGRELLVALDTAGYPVFAAFWLLRPEASDWMLYIGSTLIDQQGRHAAYSRLQGSLADTDVDIPLRAITIVGSSDPLVQLLSAAIVVNAISEIRFEKNVINGVLIPDALIYRLRRPDPAAGSGLAIPTSERPKSRTKPVPTKRTNTPKVRSKRK